MKLWHDDIRRPPDDTWVWARTNQEAMVYLLTGEVTEASLDHDLGLEAYDPDMQDADLQRGWDEVNDGYTLIESMIANDVVPPIIAIHSWNPPGAQRMARRLADVGVIATVRPYSRP